MRATVALPIALGLWLVASGCSATTAAPSFRCDGLPAGRTVSRTVAIEADGVPLWLRIPPRISAAPIVLWHGFGPPESAQALLDVLPLDDVPAIKVYPDLPLFGKRAPAGGSAELARRQSTDLAGLVFAPVVLGAADELPAVMAALAARGCAQPDDPVALFGFSAGGAAVLYALAERQVPVRAAVIVNASTGLRASVQAYERARQQRFDWTPEAQAIARRSDALQRHAEIAAGDPPPALLILHGAEDPMLGPEVAQALVHALQPDYADPSFAGRLKLTLMPGMAHGWAEAPQAESVRRATAAWMARWAGTETGE